MHHLKSIIEYSNINCNQTRILVSLWVRHDVLSLCGYSCHAVMVDDASKLTQQHHGEQ